MNPLRLLAVGGEPAPVVRALAAATARPAEVLGTMASLGVVLAAGADLAVDLLAWWTPDPAGHLDELRSLARLRPGTAVLIVALRPEAVGPAELALEGCCARGELRAAAVAGPDEASLRVALIRLAALEGWPLAGAASGAARGWAGAALGQPSTAAASEGIPPALAGAPPGLGGWAPPSPGGAMPTGTARDAAPLGGAAMPGVGGGDPSARAGGLPPAAGTGGAAAAWPFPGRGTEGCVVTVFSPKGGCGKTTLALNLAVLAAGVPGGCVLVDLDLETPDATALAGAGAGPDVVDLLPSVRDGGADGLPLSRHRRAGFHLVPGPARPELAPLVQPAQVASLLAALRRRHGAVVVDTCGRLGDDATLAALEAADHVLLVVVPEPASLRRAVGALELMVRIGWRPPERVRLVVNALAPDAAAGVDRIEALLGLPALAAIPYDAAAFRRAAEAGAPLALVEPGHPAVRATARVLGGLGLAAAARPPEPAGWRGWMRRLVRGVRA